MAGGAVAAVVALAFALGGSDDEPRVAAPATTSTTVDLAGVTNEELEQVVNEHPEVVPMRLRLIERYIEEQDFDAAAVHAEEAVARATTISERSLALTWLGLTTAILGDPEAGEGLLVQSLALDPTNRESLYYLARVRFEFLDQPDGAVRPLEELLSLDITGDQRTLFEEMLAQARVAAGVAVTTTTAAP
jgi:cytochrome c-type biogenesis protein CcmH/NrfG